MLHLEVPKNYSRVLRTFDVDLETKGGFKIVKKKNSLGFRSRASEKTCPIWMVFLNFKNLATKR